MKETIVNLKSLVRRYKTFLSERYTNYKLSSKDLEAIRQAIRYLELIEIAVNEYNDSGDDNDKNS